MLCGESFEGVEAVVTNPDGRQWVGRVNIEPLRDEAGGVVGAVNCFQDVTREYELRQATALHLSQLEQAEELQRLLVNELNHRVKNSLATAQSIASQTLRSATDLPAARLAIDARIASLGRAHDLLTDRSWSGANLRDVVKRALQPFAAGQFDIAGPSLELSPRHALALSLALHELATNAAKYGALSCPQGRVSVTWEVEDGRLRLSWCETGGPPVTAPTRRGFGARLLKDNLFRELGGETRLEYRPEGVRYDIAADVALRS